MIRKIGIINLFIGLLILINSCSQAKKVNKTENMEEMGISIIDSLLFEEDFNDHLNFDSLLNDDSNLFMDQLIERIDINNKVILLDTSTPLNPLLSNIPQKKCYVGIRAICFLNELIHSPDFQFKDEGDIVCRYCISCTQKKDGTEVDLETLTKVEALYRKWFDSTQNMLFENKKEIWNAQYSDKVSSLFL